MRHAPTNQLFLQECRYASEQEGERASERDWNYDYGIQQLCYDRSGKDNGNADEGGKMGRARKGGLLLCYTLVG